MGKVGSVGSGWEWLGVELLGDGKREWREDTSHSRAVIKEATGVVCFRRISCGGGEG